MTTQTARTDRKDAILRAVARTGELLLRRGPLEERLDEALAALGEATGVDRVYVFRTDHGPDGILTSQTNEWSRPGVAPQIDNPELQDLPLAEVGFARWVEVLATGGAIHGAVADFPPSEQALLASQDILALAVVPVVVEGAWWGFVGFDLTDERPFAASEVAALRSAAGIIGAAIGQRRVWQQLEDNRQQLAAVLVAEREYVARLEDLDRMKNAFIDAVSHELRTPLASVLGLAETLDRVALDDTDRAAVLERLRANATRLDEVLGRLLDLTRLRAAAERLDPGPVELSELVGQVVGDHRAAVDRAVRVEAGGSAVVDTRVLTRILDHLLDNAAVHTEPGSAVWVTAEPLPDGVRLTVADDGHGIDEAHRTRVFEAFSHGASRRPHAPGTGVGLSLVAGLARLHHGRAWCDERPGGGAAFHVELRVPPTDDRPASADPDAA